MANNAIAIGLAIALIAFIFALMIGFYFLEPEVDYDP
jgi:hypothetical protein